MEVCVSGKARGLALYMLPAKPGALLYQERRPYYFHFMIQENFCDLFPAGLLL